MATLLSFRALLLCIPFGDRHAIMPKCRLLTARSAVPLPLGVEVEVVQLDMLVVGSAAVSGTVKVPVH